MSRKNKRQRQQAARTRAADGGQGAGGIGKVTIPEREPVLEVPTRDEVVLHIPKGITSAWSDEEWDTFAYGLEALSDDGQDRVWDILQEREDYAALGVEIDEWEDEGIIGDASIGFSSVLDNKPLHEMTDEEWMEYQMKEAWPEDSAPKQTALQIAKDAALVSKPGAHCSCNGPGSKTEKFKTHTSSCDAYIKPVVSASTFKGRTCTHDRDTVKLDDGLTVFASGKFDVKKLDDKVQFGIYLDRGWQGYESPVSTIGVWAEWMQDAANDHHPSVYLNWPDRKRPSTSPEVMVKLGNWIFEQSKQGLGIEIGCLGGHGRTGTLLACLLALQGHNPYDAVNRLWADYCTQAVEDASQMSYIAEVYELVHGSEWRQSKDMRKKYADWMHDYFAPTPAYKSPYYNSPYQYKGKLGSQSVTKMNSILGIGSEDWF